MFILGIQGSPRVKGNSRWLLNSFLEECERHGATTRAIDSCKADILPCKELIVCEKKGYCPLKDEMEESIYALIRQADIVVLASPVFFYNVSAQVKILIDRCQMFWGRKYKLKLLDPQSFTRQGFLLSVAASGGKKLFDGVHLTAKYFFDAISADYHGALTYKKIETAKQIQSHPTVIADIKKAAKELCIPFIEKKSLLFLSRHDACRGQIAGAFARTQTKGEWTVRTAGYDAKEQVQPELVPAMAGRGLDLMYQKPRPLDDVTFGRMPDIIVHLGSGKTPLEIPAKIVHHWKVAPLEEVSSDVLNCLMDDLENRVQNLLVSMS